jgi:hypothetical protein
MFERLKHPYPADFLIDPEGDELTNKVKSGRREAPKL